MLSTTPTPLAGLLRLGLGALLLAGLSQGLTPAAARAAAGGTTQPCPSPTVATPAASPGSSTSTSMTTTSTETPRNESTTTGSGGTGGPGAVVLPGPARVLGADPAAGCPDALPFTGAATLPLLVAAAGLAAVGVVGVRASHHRESAPSR